MTPLLLALCAAAGPADPAPVVLRGHAGAVLAAAFAPDGKQVASGGLDRTVRVWDPAGAAPPRTLGTCAGKVQGLAYSPDGTTLVATAGDARTGEVVAFDPVGGTVRWRVPTDTHSVTHPAVAPNGRTVAVAAEGAGVLLLDAGGKPLGRLHVPDAPHEVTAVAYSADGRLLASADRGGIVRFWDMVTVRHHSALGVNKAAAGRAVGGLAFSPDGQTVALASPDGPVLLIDPETRLIQSELLAHRTPAGRLAFAPDGRTLATTAPADSDARVWRAAFFQPAGRLRGHDDGVFDVRFSPDGRRLVTAGGDGTVRVWPAPPVAPPRP